MELYYRAQRQVQSEQWPEPPKVIPKATPQQPRPQVRPAAVLRPAIPKATAIPRAAAQPGRLAPTPKSNGLSIRIPSSMGELIYQPQSTLNLNQAFLCSGSGFHV